MRTISRIQSPQTRFGVIQYHASERILGSSVVQITVTGQDKDTFRPYASVLNQNCSKDTPETPWEFTLQLQNKPIQKASIQIIPEHLFAACSFSPLLSPGTLREGEKSKILPPVLEAMLQHQPEQTKHFLPQLLDSLKLGAHGQ